MNKTFVEIDEYTLRELKKVAKSNGCKTVEELLTAFAKNFSTGCSVTLAIGDLLAKRAVA